MLGKENLMVDFGSASRRTELTSGLRGGLPVGVKHGLMVCGHLVNGLCGLVFLLVPGMPPLLRLAGMAVFALTIFSACRWFWPGGAALRGPARDVAPAAPEAGVVQALEMIESAELPIALEAASAGTPRDMRTAMGLFGSAIIDQVETSVSTVLKENQQMREMANEMAAGAIQAQTQFKSATARSTEAEGAFEQLNEVSGELARSIGVIGAAARVSLVTVTEAIAQAATTRRCIETMAALSDAVSQAIALIEQVARQTKMLSINALIEAARAGSAGKGFAVVAGEVRTLANQTAAATQTIGEKIGQLNGMVTQSVDSLHALVSTSENVAVSNQAIAEAVIVQEGLSARLQVSSKSMNAAVYTLSKEIREAAQLASNSGMLSEMVLETATSVDALMNTLKTSLQEIGIGMEPVMAGEEGPAAVLEHAVYA
jgi:methyl-accepting chemotaxis protein